MFRAEFMPPFGPPSVRPFTIPIVAAKQLSQVERSDNIWIVPSRDGREIAAITLDWSYGNQDMNLGYWKPDDVVDSKYILQVTLLLQAQLDEVTAQIQGSSSPDEDDLHRQWELEEEMDRLSRHRFWVEKNNAFGDGCQALYRAVTTANIPWRITSADKVIGANQAFTIHLYRFQHDPGQARKRLRIRWGGYMLEFPSDGPEAKLYVLNPELSDDETTEMLEDWQVYEDQRSMTPIEQTSISTWRLEIETIKGLAQDPTRSPKGLTAIEEAQIAALKTDISQLKASKGLTPAQARAMKDLEEELYVSSSSANLGLATQTGVNVPISLTFIADPRGYLIIHASPGNNVSIHELKTITATQQFGVLWKPTKLTLEADGGAFFFRQSYPNVSRWGQLVSRNYQLGFAPGEISWSNQSWIPQGTSMTPAASPTDQSVSWLLTLESSDMRSFPFVYTLTMEAAAVPRDVDERVLHVLKGDVIEDWNLRNEGNRRNGTLIVRSEEGLHDWLADMENYQVRIYDRTRLVFTGVVRNPMREERGGIRKHVVWEMTVLDRWSLFAGDLMWNEPPGDGKEFAYYIKQIAQGRGLEDNEILVTDSALTLPAASAGQKYALMPKQGADRAQWLEEMASKYALGYTIRFDGRGRLVIGPPAELADTRYRFSTSRVSLVDKRLAAGDVRRTWDWDDFYNHITVLGAKNPATGVRYSASWIDGRSVVDDQYEYYIKDWRQLPPIQDESLTTQNACDVVCRRLWELHGTPKFLISFITHHHDELREGDLVFLDGAPVEIVGIPRASRGEDRMDLDVKELR